MLFVYIYFTFLINLIVLFKNYIINQILIILMYVKSSVLKIVFGTFLFFNSVLLYIYAQSLQLFHQFQHTSYISQDFKTRKCFDELGH